MPDNKQQNPNKQSDQMDDKQNRQINQPNRNDPDQDRQHTQQGGKSDKMQEPTKTRDDQ